MASSTRRGVERFQYSALMLAIPRDSRPKWPGKELSWGIGDSGKTAGCMRTRNLSSDREEMMSGSAREYQEEQFCQAVRLSRRRDLRYSRRSIGYAVEHVLAYSGDRDQVPYNQHLE